MKTAIAICMLCLVQAIYAEEVKNDVAELTKRAVVVLVAKVTKFEGGHGVTRNGKYAYWGSFDFGKAEVLKGEDEYEVMRHTQYFPYKSERYTFYLDRPTPAAVGDSYLLFYIAQPGTSHMEQVTPAISAATPESLKAVETLMAEPPVRPADPTKAKAEDDIREATFRHQLSSSPLKGAKVFFLSINGKNPSDEFMLRFSDQKTVRKREQARREAKQIKDKQTGDTGVIYSTENLKWVNDREVEVEGGWYCGGLCSGRVGYHLKKEAGKWVVKKAVIHRIGM